MSDLSRQFFLHHAQRALSTLAGRERGDFEKLLEQNETDSVQALQQRSMSIWNELLLFTRIRRERWWREENDNFGRRITYFDDADFGGLSRRFEESGRKTMKINKAHQSLDTCINRKVVVVPPL